MSNHVNKSFIYLFMAVITFLAATGIPIKSEALDQNGE
jgi:membrane protein YqaA with SNARE-associated domain